MTDSGRVRILVVCTANRCRSPLAAVMLQHALDRRGQAIEVQTAGLRSPGLPATDETSSIAGRRSFDLTGHRSRRLSADDIEGAALIVGMERLHVREVVAVVPDAWPRTFTLKELARRGAVVGPRHDDEALSVWLGRVHAGREARDLMGESSDDDVTDPTGAGIGEHEDLARELEALIDQIASLISIRPEPEPDPISWMAS